MAAFQSFLALLLLFLCVAANAQGLDQVVAQSSQPVRFEITLTWEEWSATGAPRKMILTNGRFPAPALQLRQGDYVEFLVTNRLPVASAVHFHGISQTGTPWSDGVPGLSQKPIPPGGQFLYKWRATEYGSYFYHAHSRGQVEDGLYGAIYIRPDDTVERPFKLIAGDENDLRAMRKAEDKTRPIILSDWRHVASEEMWRVQKETGLEAYCVNALLINGKGSVNCLGEKVLNEATTPEHRMFLGKQSLSDIGCMPPTLVQGDYPHNLTDVPPSFWSGCVPSQGAHEKLPVRPSDKYVSYDLIGAAGLAMTAFAIDEHPMWIYAVDGRYVEPAKADFLTVSNGNRYSVLVALDKPAGDYTIRVANQGVNQIINSTAVMSYISLPKNPRRASTPSIDITGAPIDKHTVLDDNKLVPFPVEVPSQDVAQTHHDTPLLFHPETAPKDLTISTQNGTWVDLIFAAVQPLQPPHPFHKHSNKFFVIGAGDGEWNYTSVADAVRHRPGDFNLKTPQIRDTATTPPAATGPTWMAIRYHVVNPGAFLLHCHIQVHLTGGMGVVLLDGVDEWPEVPEAYQEVEAS
ncbi:multicopper oxidase-domain-containing protein [Aspergillus candidus]|uniref:Multicopper oxidase-domain-containing protein n=1 Tax=Aspergillus candidus TaxID=41067 RepID=A0A2I2F9Q9_ASPCN|nr:multicopper oxidase-domain-containing protein [Aspergillus candidus]PLB37359.1 multicopper oxidase-domain-containing protein [Aspergillus candidus]